MSDRDQWPAYGVGAALLSSAVLHLARPRTFRPLMPRQLPHTDAWIYASGVVEGVCGAGLLTRRPWAGRAAAAVLLAIWPANVQMALDAGSGRNRGPADARWLAWGRVPLQLPLIWAALRSRPRRVRR